MTEFEDFKPFFDAMIEKMQEKDAEKGDSWKDDYWLEYPPHGGRELPPIRHNVSSLLRKGLKKETKEYFATYDDTELVDIANFCAMLYMRICSDSTKESEDEQEWAYEEETWKGPNSTPTTKVEKE